MPPISPIIIPLVIFMIPIIAILTGHQRRMAEIMYASRGQQNVDVDPRLVNELASVRMELAEVKSLLHQQAIAIDNLGPRMPMPDVSQRLENVSR